VAVVAVRTGVLVISESGYSVRNSEPRPCHVPHYNIGYFSPLDIKLNLLALKLETKGLQLECRLACSGQLDYSLAMCPARYQPLYQYQPRGGQG
jgi:hypothetical protein